ncbi:MAG TPA: sensor histidine kinase [Methanoregula sp.]|nr:sensor histidine kinase [Methanoregula sp.]
MSTNPVKKAGMSRSRLVAYLAAVALCSVLLFIASGALDLTGTLYRSLEAYPSFHLDGIFIVALFLAVALAVLSARLWRGLKQEVQGHQATHRSLVRATKNLAFLNSIANQDILNQLTELSADLERDGGRTDIGRVREAIERIHRQVKFIKEYQDIGTNPPQWQDVADTVMRARVGVNLGKVTVDVEMKNVTVYADRLLEKAFYYLIDNAIRHGGGKLSRIRFSDRISEESLVIACEDDGAGIPPEKKGALFPETHGPHIGYGLFFVKEVLATTGITIRETGIPGKGARFEIRVPPGMYRKTA